MRELIGLGLQPRVRQFHLPVRHRHRVGRARHLRFHPLVHQARPVGRVDGPAPLLHKLSALLGPQQRQVGDACLRPGDRRVQQPHVVLREAAHRRLVEEGRAVLPDAHPAVRRLPQEQRQVELRDTGLEVHLLRHQPVQPHQGRRALQDEHRLEQRRAAQVPHGLQRVHQRLEGHVLVRVRPQARLAHAAQQAPEALPFLHVHAQGQRVGEEADQPLQLAPVAPRNRRAHHHVPLPAVARQQCLEARQQQHEGRHRLLTAALQRRAHQLRGHGHVQHRTLDGLHRRPRPVQGELQHGRHAPELLLPPGELRLQHVTLQPLALPQRVVHVLHRQRPRRGLRAGMKRGVQLPQLTLQHAERPPVTRNVVQSEQQHVLLRLHAQQPRPQQRPRLQVERQPRVLLRAPHHLALARLLWQPLQRLHRQRHRHFWRNALHGLAFDFRERGAQRLVPLHHAGQCPLQRRHVQRSLQAREEGRVVRVALRVQLREEPHALLRERQRRRPLPGHGHHRGRPTAPGRRGLRLARAHVGTSLSGRLKPPAWSGPAREAAPRKARRRAPAC